MARSLDELFRLVTSVQEGSNEMAQRLEKIGESIGEQVSEIKVRVVTVEAAVKALAEDVHGSADSPLPVRVALVEHRVERMEESQIRDMGRRWQIALLLIGAMLTSLGAFLIAVFNLLTR